MSMVQCHHRRVAGHETKYRGTRQASPLVQDARRAVEVTARIEEKIAGRASDDGHASQLRTERGDQPLFASRLGIDEQQAELVPPSRARIPLEARA